MEILYQILGALAIIFLVYLMVKTVQNNPEMFTKEVLSKSFFSMGILALLLIGFLTFIIVLLKQ